MATEHFSDAELECKCLCGGLPPQDFQDHLEELRVVFGEPMIVTSGYRCPDYNQQVSSTGQDGPHTIAAVDIGISGAKALRLTGLAWQMGWTGIGWNQRGSSRFVHLDRLPQAGGRPRPWCWSYP